MSIAMPPVATRLASCSTPFSPMRPGGSNFPVREDHPALGLALGVSDQRHAEIGPAHTTAERDEPVVRLIVLALQPDRDAARAAPTREVGEQPHHVVERRKIPQGELE